ncbi:MAG: cell cycle transcriptional regulator TrcR, partial [Pseudomonadota bacterium]
VAGQLRQEELDRCVANPKAEMQISANIVDSLVGSKKKKPSKYTPVARRQDKPDAIYWLIKTCPDVNDAQIAKLVGTTKTTIAAIRDRSHWNMKNIRPRDPVLLGICSQSDLDRLMAQFGSSSSKHINEDLII